MIEMRLLYVDFFGVLIVAMVEVLANRNVRNIFQRFFQTLISIPKKETNVSVFGHALWLRLKPEFHPPSAWPKSRPKGSNLEIL